jgi:hypothetical protein
MAAEVGRLKAQVRQLTEELGQKRDRVRELESLLDYGLLEKLALTQHELELERKRSKKLFDENDKLRDRLYHGTRS